MNYFFQRLDSRSRHYGSIRTEGADGYFTKMNTQFKRRKKHMLNSIPWDL